MHLDSSDAWPGVTVIVAALNEAALMPGKLRDLAALDYPRDRLEVIVVDGGSSDGTQAIATAHAAGRQRVCVVETRHENKTAQINEALARVCTPWVLITDADARMPADTLRRLVAAARADPRVAVVGTTSMPHQPHPLDAWHWRISNAVRRVEHRLGRTTGLVVAPCYLLQRALVARLPDDVVADDVHVACRAAEIGRRTALVETDVEELRGAATLRSWLGHKVRRTLAYLREVFRFLPTAPRMIGPMRAVFLWRAAALTVGPPIAAGVLIATVVASGPAVGTAVAGVMLSAAATGGTALARSRLVDGIVAVALPLWIVVVTATALVSYPFVRQRASFPRTALRTREREVCP